MIAEAGVNHNGDLGRAFELVDAAVAAGADAVKFQTFRAADLVSSDAPRVAYQVEGSPGDDSSDPSQLSLLTKLELPIEAFAKLAAYSEEQGILFLSSPHTERAVDELAPLVPAFKLGSGDIDHALLLRRVASHKKPIILGTGMSTLSEVQRAARWLTDAGATELVFLHATTRYPCPFEQVNLRAMQTLAATLPHAVGYSDHTAGIEVAIMAATLGAVVIEKHFTLDRSLPGPDHAASLEPDELRRLVTAVHHVPSILGSDEKRPTPEEADEMHLIRKSLTATRDLETGTVLSANDLQGKRPAIGVSVAEADLLVGCRLVRKIRAGATVPADAVERLDAALG